MWWVLLAPVQYLTGKVVCIKVINGGGNQKRVRRQSPATAESANLGDEHSMPFFTQKNFWGSRLGWPRASKLTAGLLARGWLTSRPTELTVQQRFSHMTVQQSALGERRLESVRRSVAAELQGTAQHVPWGT
jgi:hypothetical protein